MQIILQEDVEKLGHRGDVVTVKPGYARNFLLPNKIGIQATAGNMKALERIRGALAKKTATELDAAKKQAELLSGVAVRFHRKTGEERPDVRLRHHGRHRRSAEGAKFGSGQAPGAACRSHQDHRRIPVTVKVFRDVTAEIKVHVEKEV
jgi:large subunit ribosomal protein L9